MTTGIGSSVLSTFRRVGQEITSRMPIGLVRSGKDGVMGDSDWLIVKPFFKTVWNIVVVFPGKSVSL